MERKGGGRRMLMIAIVALVIVLVLDAAAYFVLPPLDTVRPATATAGPSPTPVPTETPFPTPTEVPCEPQVWWDGSSETVEAFYATDVLEGNIADDTDFAALVSEQRTLLDAVEALPTPPCLADARDNLLDALDARVSALNTPSAADILTADSLAGLPLENVRQYYTFIADSYDNLAAFIAQMEELGVSFNNGDINGEIGVGRDYAEANTLDCMATRWALTEALPWIALSGAYQVAVNADPIDRDRLRRLTFELQNEGSRITGAPYPDCVEDARADLLEANDALVLVIQGILAGDTAASGDNLPDYSRALDSLQREINSSISFLDI